MKGPKRRRSQRPARQAFGGARREAGTPFWQRKTLAQMTASEWESLCDGCGRCCVLKFQDEDTGAIHPTAVACRLLDANSARCRRYRDRHALVPECLRLDPALVRRYDFLPGSCAYRRLAEGRGLASWHPLVSGSAQSVVDAGISVRGQVVSEQAVHPDEPLQEHIVRWVDP